MSERHDAREGLTDTPSLDDLLTARQVSEITGLGVTTLDQYRQRWKRGKRLGPAFVKLGWNVFYTRQAVDAWLARADASARNREG